MANRIHRGFVPWNISFADTYVQEYEVASGYATALATGDPVSILTDGTLARVIDGASDATLIAGIVREISYVNADGVRVTSTYYAGSSTYTPTTRGSVNAAKATIWMTLPGVYFRNSIVSTASANHDTTAELYGLIGCNMDHNNATADAVYKESKSQLDGTAVAATAQWRVVNVVPQEIGQSGILSSAELLVECNEGFWSHNSTAGL